MDCRMYLDTFPCADCARAIIQSGIAQLNTFAPDATDANFSRHYTVAETMFSESGIALRIFQKSDLLLKRAREAFVTAS
jgi:dCMP deaminase